MKIEDWFEWPTKSTDPAANAAIAVLLALALFIALAVGAVIFIPVILVLALAKAIHWYVNRPTPTDQLYLQTEQRVVAAKFPSAEAFVGAHADRLLDAIRDEPPAYDVYVRMIRTADALYKEERLDNLLPPIAPTGTIEDGRYRDRLIAFNKKSEDAQRTLEVINNTISTAYLKFLGTLPPLAKVPLEVFAQTDEIEHPATLPLIDIIPDVGKTVLAFMMPFYAEPVTELALFAPLRKQLDENYQETDPRKPISPDEHKGTPQEIVRAYLANTPLEHLFYALVPFAVPQQTRFEHSWLCAGSGHGKTNAIATMIQHDLDGVAAGQCSIVVMDSQNQLIPEVAKLKLFAPGQPLHDKLVLIDPTDIEFPVQLNLFSIGKERLNSYSMLERERLLNSTIELYDFVLSALLGSEMTARQGTLFRFSTQLMMVIPDATIHTFRELMQPGGYDKYKPYIEKLGGTAKEFFETQFNGKIFEQTKQQVVARLFTICENRTFERLFTHPKSKLDLFTEINTGKVILINTAKDLLKQQGTEVFGRFFLALIGQAAQERATLPDKKPVYCYIDECQDYIASDSNFTVILEQARKQKIAMTVAHQYLTQLSQHTLDSLYANTSTKYAGGVSDKDAYALARNMATEPAFVLHQPKGTFTTYVRNYTTRAVSLKFPLSDLAKRPQMTNEEQVSVRAAIRAKYAVPFNELQQSSAKPSSPATDEPKEFADRY